MELRHLRYFVAIAEERSITRAAERLWIAQPGLSTQVRRLEAELGIQLLHRHTRGVDLTDAGEVFLERARATLAAAEEARSTGRELEAGLVGSLRLGIATELPARFGPSLLAGFGRERPDVELTVLESYSGTLLRDLRDARVDALLAPAGRRVGRVALGPGGLGAVGRAGRPRTPARRPGPIGAAELEGERLWSRDTATARPMTGGRRDARRARRHRGAEAGRPGAGAATPPSPPGTPSP